MELPIKKEESINIGNIYYDKDGYCQSGLGIVKDTVACLRPAHSSGKPQVYAEIKGDKVISHNYGHSGEGYTILFGTIEKSIENMLKIYSKFDKKDEITIIGMGCIGLTTAFCLLEKGYKNLKIIGEKFYNTPSFYAGGLFDLVHSYKDEQLEIINKYFEETYLKYKELMKNNFFTDSIREVEFYVDFLEDNAGLSYLAKKGIIDLKQVKLQFHKNSQVVSEFEVLNCKTIHVVTSIYMEQLLKLLKNNNVQFENRKVLSFNEISSKLIFNCTGLGSLELNNDRGMYPICGHGINFNNEDLGKKNFILLLNSVKGLENTNSKGCLYFMPKITGFIGGTFMNNYSGDNEKLNKEMVKGIIERANFVFNGIKPKF